MDDRLLHVIKKVWDTYMYIIKKKNCIQRNDYIAPKCVDIWL